MAYDILDIEAKRLAAVTALENLMRVLPGMYDHPLASNENLQCLPALATRARAFIWHPSPCHCLYCRAVDDARAQAESLTGPSDSFEPDLPWLSDEYKPKRFILKACNLWSDEYQKPMVVDPRSWSSINLAADAISDYLKDPKYSQALTPDTFLKYYQSTTDSPLRPSWIPERFNDFLSWCRAKGYIA